MVDPLSAWLPPFGDIDTTVASSSCGPLTLTWNPAASKMLFASASVELATNGTLTCCLPVDTQMVTAVPASTVLPEPGSMRVTAPDCTESEYSLSMVICVRPACLSCAMTESLPWPTRPSGILVIPDEIYSVMMVPLVCFECAAGLVFTTLSFSMEALSTVMTLPILKPAASRMPFASSCVLPDTSGTLTACGPVENHTETVEPFATFLPPFGFCLVMVPFGWLDVESSRASSFRPRALSCSSTRAWEMFDVSVKSGTDTRSAVFLCPFNAKKIPMTASKTTMLPTTEAMMICFFLRSCAALARCSARVFVSTPPFGFGTASNWPVTGLNACVGASVAGAMGTVAASISACLRAFMLVRSVNGLNAAAIGTPPFMNVSRSFLNSEAVA